MDRYVFGLSSLVPTATVLLLLLCTLCPGLTQGEIYYVSSTRQTLCPKDLKNERPCMSLSEYASKPSSYFNNQTTLILLPGNHTLDKTLSLSGLSVVEVIGTTGSTTLVCSKRGRFEFKSINFVQVSGLLAFDCGPNEFQSLARLTFENCLFDGRGYSNTGILLKDVANAGIVGATFLHNAALITVDTPFDGGNHIASGCIAILTSHVFITNSSFDGNMAVRDAENEFAFCVGGAIYSDQSTLEVNDCTFTNNLASNSGGAFYVLDTSITIKNCDISHNKAHWAGAILAVAYHVGTNVTLINCTLNYNNAFASGGIMSHRYGIRANVRIEIQASRFSNNTVESEGGVLFADSFSDIWINNSLFENNTARTLSGVLQVQDRTTLLVQNSRFQNNVGELFGGVIGGCSESKIILEYSHFVGNKASLGASVGDLSSTIAKIVNCTFRNNGESDDTGLKIFATGGVFFVTNGSVLISEHSNFSNNFAAYGGVFTIEYSTVTLLNSIMISNVALNYGGTIVCERRSTVNLINTTIAYSRVSPLGEGVVYIRDNCNFTSEGYFHLHNSNASKGVVFILHGSLTLLGETSFVNNFGSVSAINSRVSFNGNALFMRNTPRFDVNNTSDKYTEGGALSVFQSELYLLGNTTIISNSAENGGAIQAIQSAVYLSGVVNISYNRATVSGGGIYAYQSQISFNGTSTIGNNVAALNGGGIHAISSTIKYLNGTHTLRGNNATKGGGISFDLNSKALLVKNTIEKYNCSIDVMFDYPCIQNPTKMLLLKLIENSAEYGGALFVNDGSNSGSCTTGVPDTYSLATECFFQTVSVYWDVFETKHLNNTIFQDNIATERGSNLFGGLLDRCTFSPYIEKRYDKDEVELLYHNSLEYLQTTTNIDLSSISSEPVRVCFCRHSRPDCSFTPPNIEVIKGQTITISAVAVDQVNHTLPSTIHSSLSSQGGGLSEGESKQSTSENCTDLRYTVLSPYKTEELVLYAEGPCQDIGISNQSIEVKFMPCPIGFTLTSSKTHCDCDPSLKPYVTNCSVFTSSLLRNGEFWIQYVANQSGYLIYPHCPFDYCFPPTQTVTINLNVENGTDSQCVFNRSGKLCGECKSGLSLSLGSTHCRRCSNYWLLLLIPFALAGVLLVAFLLLLNLTVAIGTINGLVFYANVITANRASLFPSDLSNIVTVFIAWINLDFGFETCFFDGMDAYVKTWLQFVFPLYVIFLVAAIIVVSDYSTKFASLFTRKNPEATLATLILLSYTKLLRTIIAALSFARLDYPDGSHATVWLLDANVGYLQGKHIPLFIVAIVTALVGLAYTLVLFSWQWLVKYSNSKLFKWTRNTYLNSFMDAYHAPLNGKHRYWTGLLLITRMFMLMVSAVNIFGDARVNLLAIICATVFLFLLQKFQTQRPYRKWPIDVLEFTFIVNLTIFAAASFYCRDNPNNQAALAYTSISIALLTFVGITFYHMYKFAFQKSSLLGRIKDKLKQWLLICKTHEGKHTRELLDVSEGNFPNHDHVEVLSDNVSFTVLDVTQYANEAKEDSTETHNSFETLPTQMQEDSNESEQEEVDTHSQTRSDETGLLLEHF